MQHDDIAARIEAFDGANGGGVGCHKDKGAYHLYLLETEAPIARLEPKTAVIVGAHDTGPLIRSRDGFWLAIPLPAAGKSLRGGRITPGEWERARSASAIRLSEHGPQPAGGGGADDTKG